MIRELNSTGQRKAGNEDISVTVADRFVAKVEDWDSFCKWAAANDRTDLLRKQANVKPLEEMVENGEELPPTASLDVISRLNKRRVN